MTDRDLIMAVLGIAFLVLQFIMQSNYRKVTEKTTEVIKDLRTYLDNQNKAVMDVLNSIERAANHQCTLLTSLTDFHNRYDNSGRPMWFLPERTLAKIDEIYNIVKSGSPD